MLTKCLEARNLVVIRQYLAPTKKDARRLLHIFLMIQLNQESYRDCQKVIINERGSLFIDKGIIALQKASLKKHFE